VLAAAWWRIRGKAGVELRAFLLGGAVLGLVSVPLSWWLLERVGWVLIPQIQPARALLFVMLGAQFACAAAGVMARRRVEAFAWFAVAFLLAVGPLEWRRVVVALALAAVVAAG